MNVTIGFRQPKGGITIHSISGGLVKTVDIIDAQFELEVDLQDLKPGMYFYKLKGESGETKMSKLLIFK